MARKILRAVDADNEGQRRLRVLLRARSAAAVARKMGRDPTAVRRWASGKRTPEPGARKDLEEVWGIEASSWEEPVGAEPPTERR